MTASNPGIARINEVEHRVSATHGIEVNGVFSHDLLVRLGVANVASDIPWGTINPTTNRLDNRFQIDLTIDLLNQATNEVRYTTMQTLYQEMMTFGDYVTTTQVVTKTRTVDVEVPNIARITDQRFVGYSETTGFLYQEISDGTIRLRLGDNAPYPALGETIWFEHDTPAGSAERAHFTVGKLHRLQLHRPVLLRGLRRRFRTAHSNTRGTIGCWIIATMRPVRPASCWHGATAPARTQTATSRRSCLMI